MKVIITITVAFVFALFVPVGADAQEPNLAVTMVSEGLAWVIESELDDKHAKPGSSKKLIDEADALLKAQEEARKANRGLWADENPIAPWERRGREKDGK